MSHLLIDVLPTVLALFGVLDDGLRGKGLDQVRHTVECHAYHKERDTLIDERTGKMSIRFLVLSRHVLLEMRYP